MDNADPERKTSVWWSSNGNSFTQVYLPTTGGYVQDITYTECDRYVGGGTHGLVVTSDDGINWTERLPNDPYSSPTTFTGVSDMNGKVIGVGFASQIYYSDCDCNCD
jgi:photosystem II stability/assembly factor-like uncharacterized protein